MAEQLPLPEMPEMKPLAPPSPAQAPSPPMPTGNRPAPVGRGRLRQIVGYLAGGGFGLVVLVCAGELVLKDEYRPTTFLSMIEARTALGEMNQKLGAEPGKMVLTEDEYRSRIAQAEREGQAEAELAYQRELAVVQADKERVVGAYSTLYQRANMIAQAGLQLENTAQQMRARLLETSNGGRNVVIMFKDIICGLGDRQACASAKEDRTIMIGEADELSRGDVGKRINELMAGIDDPASFVTREDRKRHGTPTIR